MCTCLLCTGYILGFMYTRLSSVSFFIFLFLCTQVCFVYVNNWVLRSRVCCVRKYLLPCTRVCCVRKYLGFVFTSLLCAQTFGPVYTSSLCTLVAVIEYTQILSRSKNAAQGERDGRPPTLPGGAGGSRGLRYEPFNTVVHGYNLPPCSHVCFRPAPAPHPLTPTHPSPPLLTHSLFTVTNRKSTPFSAMRCSHSPFFSFYNP